MTFCKHVRLSVMCNKRLLTYLLTYLLTNNIKIIINERKLKQWRAFGERTPPPRRIQSRYGIRIRMISRIWRRIPYQKVHLWQNCHENQIIFHIYNVESALAYLAMLKILQILQSIPTDEQTDRQTPCKTIISFPKAERWTEKNPKNGQKFCEVSAVSASSSTSLTVLQPAADDFCCALLWQRNDVISIFILIIFYSRAAGRNVAARNVWNATCSVVRRRRWSRRDKICRMLLVHGRVRFDTVTVLRTHRLAHGYLRAYTTRRFLVRLCFNVDNIYR